MADLVREPKIYVISLARAQERRRAITCQLQDLSVAFEFVDAVDAAHVDPDWLHRQVDAAAVKRNMGRQLSDPEIACAVSHRQAYREIVSNAHPGAIILEDDAIIAPEFADAVKFFRETSIAAQNEWLVYHLELLSRGCGAYNILRKKDAQMASDKLSFAERVDRISVEAHGTCAYYITAGAARSIADEPHIIAAADIWSLYARRGLGRIFVSVPSVVAHPPDQSAGYIENARRVFEIARDGEQSFVEAFFRYVWGGLRARLIRWLFQPIAERVL